MTTRTVRCAAGVALLLAALSGCRQTEGTVPRPVGQQDNKVGDISRDLLAVARGQDGATKDLRDDLGNLGGVVAPPYMVDELTTALDAALTGREMDPETAVRLSNQLFVALTALDFSAGQIAAIRSDVAASLEGAGVDPARAERVAAAVEEIQTATTSNVRRWWQWR